MIAPDVTVLLYAFREDCARHGEYHAWLQDALNGTEPVALFEPVLSAVLRTATHPAVFRPPSPRETVEAFVEGPRGRLLDSHAVLGDVGAHGQRGPLRALDALRAGQAHLHEGGDRYPLLPGPGPDVHGRCPDVE